MGAKGAGRMSFQAGVMQGSRGSFAQPRSDASFAVGLPQSAANAGKSRQSFTTQPSEGFSSMPPGGTSTQPPPKGSSTKQQMGRMAGIHMKFQSSRTSHSMPHWRGRDKK